MALLSTTSLSSRPTRTFPLALWLAVGAVLTAVFQYVFVVSAQLTEGEAILTAADVDQLQSGGSLRYLKDAFLVFLVVLSAYYLRRLTRNPVLRQLLPSYLIWLSAVVTLGIVPLLVLNNPLLFTVAGLRWILLLHAGMCLFAFGLRFPLERRHRRLFADMLIVIAGADVVLLWQQSASLYDLQAGAGAARLGGFFTQAGVAGTFAIFVGTIAWAMTDIGGVRRLIMFVFCAFISIAAGSRFGMICLAILLYSSFDDVFKKKTGLLAVMGRTLLIISACSAAIPLYQMMSEIVDRGDLLDVQLEEGGRIANFIDSLGIIINASPFSIIFGEGLGVGTNNAINLLNESNVVIDDLSFNRITDNTLLTIAFQFGLLGSFLFWGGLIAFWRRIRALIPSLKRGEAIFIVIVLISIISTSLFEQYFLIIGLPFAVALRARPWNVDA